MTVLSDHVYQNQTGFPVYRLRTLQRLHLWRVLFVGIQFARSYKNSGKKKEIFENRLLVSVLALAVSIF